MLCCLTRVHVYRVFISGWERQKATGSISLISEKEVNGGVSPAFRPLPQPQKVHVYCKYALLSHACSRLTVRILAVGSCETYDIVKK